MNNLKSHLIIVNLRYC